MDYAAVDHIVADWKLAASPIRPGADAINQYRRKLPPAPGWRAFIQGATPEILDLVLASGAARVVAMDRHPETMAAMRRFARQDWGRVELLVGDWCERRPEFDGVFDIVISDGGPLFLPFPEGWRRLYAATFPYLVPGGRALLRAFMEPPQPPDFWTYYGQVLERFDAERRGCAAERAATLFIGALSDVKIASYYGAVNRDGNIMLDRADRNFRALADDLRQRYADGYTRPVIEAMFGRVNQVGEDGARLVALPSFEQIRRVLEPLGFQLDMEVLNEPPAPGIMMLVSAIRPASQGYAGASPAARANRGSGNG